MITVGTAGVIGCATKTQTGAAVGAGGGAVVGGLIGKATGSTVRGAIIGAAVGGAAGAIIGAQMDKQAKELDEDIPGATVTRVGEGIVVTFDSGLLFAFNSSEIEGDARSNLQVLAQSLQKYPRSNVLIVGHTDSIGTRTYNQSLSERRASSAANFLASTGVSRERISTRGLGEEDPIADNATDSGRRENRRVEVAIYANEELRRAAEREAGE
jgi:outer membrane protein OmpA-like peptidoglycan-associated protein